MKILILPMSTEPILLRPANHNSQRYLLERRDGVVVPLIPADELPEDIKLNIQRTMSMDQAFAAGIQVVSFEAPSATSAPPNSCSSSLSSLSASSAPFHHERPKSRVANATRQSRLSPSIRTPELSEREMSSSLPAYRKEVRIGTTPGQSRLNPSLATPEFSTSELSSQPIWRAASHDTNTTRSEDLVSQHAIIDERMKRYCSHWIHYGNCDYTQQGCKFLHVIPDRETLRSIGFRSIPLWWQNRQLSGATKSSSKPTTTSGASSTDRTHDSTRTRGTRRHRRSMPSQSTAGSTFANLIDLSPDLDGPPSLSFGSSTTADEPSTLDLGPPAGLDTPKPQRKLSFEPHQQASDREASPKLDRGKELDSPHMIRRRKTGRREVYLPPKSRRSGRGKRGI